MNLTFTKAAWERIILNLENVIGHLEDMEEEEWLVDLLERELDLISRTIKKDKDSNNTYKLIPVKLQQTTVQEILDSLIENISILEG